MTHVSAVPSRTGWREPHTLTADERALLEAGGLRPFRRRVPPSAPMTAHPRPMPPPTDRGAVEAARDRTRTEAYLDAVADADLAEHRASTARTATLTGHLLGAPW